MLHSKVICSATKLNSDFIYCFIWLTFCLLQTIYLENNGGIISNLLSLMTNSIPATLTHNVHLHNQLVSTWVQLLSSSICSTVHSLGNRPNLQSYSQLSLPRSVLVTDTSSLPPHLACQIIYGPNQSSFYHTSECSACVHLFTSTVSYVNFSNGNFWVFLLFLQHSGILTRAIFPFTTVCTFAAHGPRWSSLPKGLFRSLLTAVW